MLNQFENQMEDELIIWSKNGNLEKVKQILEYD